MNPELEERVKNWAEDAEVRSRLRTELVPIMSEMRDRKRPLNELWASLFKVWSLEHETQGYVGTSNLYVPAGKKGVETLTSQLVSATFPGDDVFAVEARLPEFEKQIPAAKGMLQYLIEKSRVRAMAEKFYRLLCITGNAPVKISWEKKFIKSITKRPKGRASVEGELFLEPAEQERMLYDGPRFDVMDPANLYIYPETVDRISDALIVFEDISVPYSILAARKNKVYVASEVEAAGRGAIADKTDSDTSRLEAQGIPAPERKNAEAYSMVDISEVYLNFDPRAKTYGEEKNPVPFLVTVSANGAILRAVENPWWHKQAPYLLGRMGTVAGRIWGTGFVEAIRELQVLLNDQTNQTMDCASYHLNPIVKVKPDDVHGELPELEPGVQLLVRDMKAVEFDRPPGDLIQSGSVLTTQTQSWINDFIGAPPVLSGGSAPGRAFKTATGVGTAQKNAVVPLQEVVKLCEVEVWEPMLEFYFHLAQQFATDEMLVMLGNGAQRIRPGDIYGEYMYRWLASSQAQSQATKGSQIMQLLQTLGTPQMMAMAQQNGFKVNPAPLLRRLYQEVFGFRDVDAVLMPAAPQQPGPPQGQPPMPGQPPSLAGQPNTEPSPEFEQTRMEANDIAAMMGEMNAPGEDELS